METKNYNDDTTINELVDQYKLTLDEGLRLSLLRAFDPYFKKYAKLLCGNSIVDFSNKDTTKFLRCFMSPEERETPVTLFRASHRVVGMLRNLFKDSTEQDIYDEALCGFLIHLNRYKMMIADKTPHKSRISFTHFIQIAVRWHMIAFIAPRKKDAIYRSVNIEYVDDLSYVKPPDVGTNWSQIDLQWVHGNTSGELFKTLSEMDRYLLYLKYDEEEKNPLSDYGIARLTGLDRMWVRRRMLKIKDQLRELTLTY